MRILLTLIVSLYAAYGADLPPVNRVGITGSPRDLALAEAIELALASNLDIEIERMTLSKADQSIRAARGVFDPTFQIKPTYSHNNNPVGSVLQGVNGKLAEQDSAENFYYRQRTPWYGASLGADFTNTRTNTSTLFASINPYYNSQLILSFAMPLLRGRAIDRDRAQILVTSKQLGVSGKAFEVRVIDVVTRVQRAYWDLVAAREDTRVQADAVGLAANQLAMNQRMINSGTLAPVELAASQAELERRKDTYFASIGTLNEAENSLKNLLLPDRGAALWNSEIVPTDARTAEPDVESELKTAVERALARRPEVQQVGLLQESNAVDQRLNADLTKPQVNFTSSYTNSGLGGSLNTSPNPFSSTASTDRINQLSALAGLAPVPSTSLGSLPGSLIGGPGTALSNVFAGNYQSVAVGFSIDITARNRTAQANYATSLIEAKRLTYLKSQTEQAIEAQVRNSLQALQTARQRITAAEAGERAAKEKLDSETRLFQTGESTNFLVLTRQNEYLDARRRAVTAHLDFNKAVALLEQAAGTTLSSHKVTVK